MTSSIQYFLLLTLLAGASCLPTSGVKIQRRQTTSRDQCTATLGSCHFYSHCIESKLPCGKEGLILSYAEQRCNAINRLRSKRPGWLCQSCINLNAFRWAHQVEQCFQRKLLVLLEKYERLYHDPVVCLGWEREAVLEMNNCYNQSSDIHVHQLSEEDIKTLDSKFRIGGEYYNSMVDRGLSLVVKDRRSTLASELVRVSPMVRHIYCIKASKYTSSKEIVTSPDDYIRVIRLTVNNGTSLPLSNFHYGGRDDLHEDKPCNNHQPPGINRDADFHLVTLFENSSVAIELERNDPVEYRESGVSITAVMYELTSGSMKPPRRTTECGDGRRQATEECDYGGVSAVGCSIDCRVDRKYDCETTKLQPSVCRLEVCGDGMRTRGEVCDDRNNETGDGCDSSCQVETTHTCTRSYNSTSRCDVVLSPLQVNQIAPNRLSRSSITFRQASPSFSRDVSAHELSKRTLWPLPANSASSKSVSISWIVPCVLTVLAASLVVVR